MRLDKTGKYLLSRKTTSEPKRKSYLHSKAYNRMVAVVSCKTNFPVGPQEFRLATIKRRKLAWIGHVALYDNLQATLKGGRRRGRQRKCWMDNI